DRPSGSDEKPTTCPASLRAVAELALPPRVPTSWRTPSLKRKACWEPAAVVEKPITWPASLIAVATLVLPPRVPISRTTYCPAAAGRRPGPDARRRDRALTARAAREAAKQRGFIWKLLSPEPPG